MPEREQKEAGEHTLLAGSYSCRSGQRLHHVLNGLCCHLCRMDEEIHALLLQPSPISIIFMHPASSAAFPSAQPCCSLAPEAELLGKAQPRASSRTVCPLLCEENHGFREAPAFGLTPVLKGNTLNVSLAPLHGHLYNLHFSGAQLNLSVNQQGLVKSSRRRKE